MVNIKRNKVIETREVEVEKGVTLELTDEEAQAVKVALGQVAGNSNSSRRLTENVFCKLVDIYGLESNSPIDGVLTFRDGYIE